MVAELQARMPFGLSNAFCLARLNTAYRKIMQKTAFTFDRQTVSTTMGIGLLTFQLPTDFDTGSDATLMQFYPATNGYMPIPYLSPDKFASQKSIVTPGIVGLFSAWTFWGTTSPTTAEVGPPDAANGVAQTTFALTYYRKPIAPLTEGPAIYYPTPDAFDDLIVDFAESQVRELYGWEGADYKMKLAMENLQALVDRYRGTKRDMPGLTDAIRQGQETQNARAMGE